MRLTKNVRTVGTARLIELRWALYDTEDPDETEYLPPMVFLPDVVIKSILDQFALLTSTDTSSFLASHDYARSHQPRINTAIVKLRAEFAEMSAEAERAEKEGKGSVTEQVDVESVDNDSSDDEPETEASRLIILIPLAAARAAL